MSPTDVRLKENLKEARDRVILLEGNPLGHPPDDPRPAWLPHAPRGCFWLGVAIYLVSCLAVARWFMLRQRSALLVAVAALAVAAGVTALWLWEARAEQARPGVVIAANGVQLRKGDAATFPVRHETPVNQGVEARLLHRREGWLQIELAGGEVGWVSTQDAVVEE